MKDATNVIVGKKLKYMTTAIVSSLLLPLLRMGEAGANMWQGVGLTEKFDIDKIGSTYE